MDCNDINTRITDKDHKDGYRESLRDINSEILKMTITIREYYPELSVFLEEMPVTVSEERNQGITLIQLKTYSESLNLLLTKYILEHPISSK